MIGTGYFQYRLLFFNGCLHASFAMEMMLLSFLLPKLKSEWSLLPPYDGIIGAIVFIGMLLGTIIWSTISDKYGRKKVVIYSSLGCAIFGTLSAFAPNLYVMLLFRFGVGFCVGGDSTVYTLFAEFCPKKTRAKLLVLEQSFWGIGSLFSVFLAYLCLDTTNNKLNDWRYFLFFTAIPLWLIVIFSFIVPESPRYYMVCNDMTNAQNILNTIAELNNKKLPNDIKLKSNEIICTETERGRIKDVFCASKKYKFTSIVLYIIFWICIFTYFGLSFISKRYFDEITPQNNIYTKMIISTSADIASLIIGVIILDKIGRKNSLICSFGILFICCMTLIYDSYVVIVFTARMCSALSLMTIYIYFSEFYPTQIRSTALGFASSFGRTAGVITSFVSEDLSILIGMRLYGLAGFIGFILSMLLPMDTINTMDSIQ
eukprot:270526_1